MAKRLLTIPDIHGRTFWKYAVNQEFDNVDKIIFLGDYMDPYPWENITRMDTIRNFEEIVDFASNNKDKVVLLWGNHDTPYVYKRDFHTRVRYDSSHSNKIGEISTINNIYLLIQAFYMNGMRTIKT